MDSEKLKKFSIAPSDVPKMVRFKQESDALVQGYAKGIRDAQVLLAQIFAEANAEEAKDGANGQSNS